MKLSVKLLSVLLMMGLWAKAQPCMPLWKYRTPILVDNSLNANALTQYQLKLVINTDSLIQAGALKNDGSDLRFTNNAGVILSHWVVNNTLPSTSSEVWVRIDNVPPLTVQDVYMFTGNQQATNTADGNATFYLYDNFDGNALDFNKWTYCGGASGGTIPVVANGEIVLDGQNSQYNQLIRSVLTTTSNYIVESKVNAVSIGTGFMGWVANDDNGYGMAYETQVGITGFRLLSTNANASSDLCLSVQNQSPVNNQTIASAAGLWSFVWNEPNAQQMAIASTNTTRTDYLDSASFHLNKNVVFGSFDNSGSMSVDYMYVRKYSDIVPTYSYSSATVLVDAIDATSNGPVCEGTNLTLDVTEFPGATYDWVGPNGYIASIKSPTISTIALNQAGTYVVVVATPSGCASLTDSIQVVVDQLPVAGLLSPDALVCTESNAGVVTLTGTTGNVIFWELSQSPIGPWSPMNSTASSYSYAQLIANQYFRAHVESGACGFDTSNIATITVAEKTVGGHLDASYVDVCYGLNAGQLQVINYTGSIQQWESSLDFGSTWNVISSTSNTLNYVNLTDTIWYRVKIKNFVCDSAYSDTAVIVVHPLPQVGLSAADVCLLQPSTFVNSSTIASGNITSFVWNFGDGSGDILLAPTHEYAQPGTYTASLKLTSNKGCIDSAAVNVVVNPLPVPAFAATTECIGTATQFQNASAVTAGTIANNSWTFGDNTAAQVAVNPTHLYANFGTYDVKLICTTAAGCIDSIEHSIRVLQRANVGFSTPDVCLNQTNAFSNNTVSLQDSTTYLWTFGNGQTSTDFEPSLVYASADSFVVSLQATTFGQCINIFTDTVQIYPLPQMGFVFDNVCEYTTAEFTNLTAIEYGTMTFNWNFGDSITSTATSPTHDYDQWGNYFVHVLATSDFGCTADLTQMIAVYPLPIAHFTVENVCLNVASEFKNASTIASGTMTYEWTFDDNQASTDQHPVHTYLADGTYNPQVIVTSDYNCKDTVSYATIIYPLPQPEFTSTTICLGETTEFQNLSTINSGAITDYLWNMDDGTNSIDVAPTHDFQAWGTYSVHLKATSDFGCVVAINRDVIVHDHPVINFSFENHCVFDEVAFTNLSSVGDGLLTYDWQFGDDSVSVQSDPLHTYVTHGFFAVFLHGISEHGCADSSLQFIEIYPLPLVDAGLDNALSYGYHVPLEGIAPTATVVNWFPPATVDAYNELLTAARPLENTVFTLLVEDQYGCKNQDSVAMTVRMDYKVQPTNVLTPNGDGVNDVWEIVNADAFDVINVTVVDRWGKEVYKTRKTYQAWTGNVNLDNLPDGTYYYLITFDGNERTYQGDVTILR